MEDPLRANQKIELTLEKKLQTPISAQDSYIQQWINYFENNTLTNGVSSKLKEAAMNGKLRNCHFRSTCWQVDTNILLANNDFFKLNKIICKSTSIGFK